MVRLSFVQLALFSANWKRMSLTDDDLRALEASIACSPDGHPVVRGTGGLRKIRFALSVPLSGAS
jgi:hypothetical protein